MSLAFIAVGVVGLLMRHRGNRLGDRPPAHPAVATWGALWAAWMTRPSNESWANVGPAIDGEHVPPTRDEAATADAPSTEDDTPTTADEPGSRPTP